MILTGKTNIHWNYFLALEQDAERLSRFVEFCTPNENVYSIELARLLFAASSEVDVVAKALCELVDPPAARSNVDDYRRVLAVHLPAIPDEQVFIPRYGMTLTPWDSWASGFNPHWWHSYNHVKHHRDTHFGEANLRNTLNSLGALLVLVFCYYRQRMGKTAGVLPSEKDVMQSLQPEASLFRLSDAYYRGHLLLE